MLNKKFRNSYYLSIFKRYLNKQTVKIDHHLHTNWTDGKNTVNQMYNFYNTKKFESILFSEHSRKKSGSWFKKFCMEIRNLKIGECIPFIGTEVKILSLKGDLDISKRVESECDLIMASVHRFPGENFEGKKNIYNSSVKLKKKDIIDLEFELSINALKNSNFDILGHPFGMSIKRFNFKPKKIFFIELIKTAKKNNKIFEINYNYHKGIKDFLIDSCLEKKCLFSIGSNSHSINNSKIFDNAIEK